MYAALRRLVPFVGRYRREFLTGLGCSLAATAISLVGPWVLKHAVDDLHDGATRDRLLFYALATLGLAIAGGGFRFLMRRIVIGASRHIEYDLRNAFLAQLQRLPLEYFHRHRTGDLMSRATNDLSAVRTMIGPAVMYAVSTGVLFVVALALMFSLSVRLTLVSLAALPLVSIAVRVFGREIHIRFERIQAQLSELSAVTQESLAGVRVVRAYGQERAELDRFRRANAEYVARNRALIELQGLFYPSMTFFLGVAALLVLWLGSREVILGRLTIGEFVAFNAYLAMLSWPMIAFGWVTNLLQRGAASWQRMLDVLDTPPAVSDASARADLETPEAIGGAIDIRHLTFGFDGRPVLEDVSVSISPGQTVAIVGPTGCGKSTLLNLLPRLYDPPPGTVFVDGIDVREIPLRVLRGAVGMVPQEPFLFSISIAENIAFGVAPDGDEAARRAAIERAAAIARLDKDAADFPHGYDTMVGERGITLSGGQKQRTALARALMLQPRVLLLDDALSAVDTYTEEQILSRLRGVMRARTSIIVSHRISTVRDADLIVVLDRGRVVERGRHDELVQGGGFYADLYRKQLLEDELAAS
jgi:ATP-binding cassette subfamily B multidrug efflux pump